MMNDAQAVGDEQMQLWNGSAGRGWVELQATLDQIYKPFEDLLIEGRSARPAGRVLDVGCGTGGTTVAMAKLLGAQGQCIGMDISETMLAAARARALHDNVPAAFICADAQQYAFEPASFDMFISRFGVMFFSDPIHAFLNLRSAAKAGSEFRFAAWRSAEENPFLTTAERAAATLLQNIPAHRADAPGPFAFADPNRVRRILQESGWTNVDIHPVDIPCSFPERELVRYLTHVGPVGRILQGTDDRTRTRVVETVRPAFDAHVRGAEVRFVAACWIVNARTDV